METSMGRIWKVEVDKYDLLKRLSVIQMQLLETISKISSLEREIIKERRNYDYQRKSPRAC